MNHTSIISNHRNFYLYLLEIFNLIITMKKIFYLLSALLLLCSMSMAQDTIQLKEVYCVDVTPIKSQGRSGTCWSYSTTSFIESEVLRLGGPSLDLSEMFFVRGAYQNKAKEYVMVHGKGNFSEGGQAHDVMAVLADKGMALDEAYPGKKTDDKHNHSELVSTQKVVLDNFMSQRGAHPSDVWYTVQNALLDVFLGAEISSFDYEAENVTTKAFADQMKINADNYIELTSYSHHPFYNKVRLEVPDNWSHDLYYNLPLDELMQVMDQAILNGFSFVWDGDVSEKAFSHKQGYAMVPEKEWLGPVLQKEKNIDQEYRQQQFMSWNSTDDHLMHIVGFSKDQKGNIYYKTKNSWGTKSNDFGGYLYMSESYMRLHTVAIMIHKDALPSKIKEKLNI